MRLTINLDDDLYAMARSHAIATKTSISKALGDLLRRKTVTIRAPAEDGSNASSYFDPLLGIHVSRSDKQLNEEDIQSALDDEDLRILDVSPLTPNTRSTS